MDKKRLNKFIKSNKWIFAKTYADTFPHEYVVQPDDPKKLEEFIFFAKSIHKYGYLKAFYKSMFTYLEIDGYKYWTMGDGYGNTTIINREPLKK